MTTTILVILSLVFTGLAYHFGFSPQGRNRFRRGIAASLYGFIVMNLVLAFVAWQEGTAIASLAQHVNPYPYAKELTWLPPIPGANSRSWVLTTASSQRAVARYYRDFRYLHGWGIHGKGVNALILTKDTQCLFITMSPDRSSKTGEGTIITYTLRKNC